MWRRRKVGLALGSGAARGLAHIGVLIVLEKEGIPVDMIAGTSIGAAIGVLYAQGKSATEIKNIALDLAQDRLTHFIDPSLPRSGLIKGKKIKDRLASLIGGDIKFSDLKKPFACVATDINTGEEVVFDRGSVPEAIRASISIPGLFTVAKKGCRYLVDGGLTNPVPVSVVKQMGADFIIAVNVIPDVADRIYKEGEEKARGSKEPDIISILIQSLHIGTYSLVRASLEEADIIIEPSVAHIRAAEFHHVRDCVAKGEAAAREVLPEIKKRLKL